MKKPASLRTTLVQALPRHHLDRDGRLHMGVVNAKPWAMGRAGMAFEFRYTLRLTLLDFAGAPEEVIFPLLAWIQRWQHELLQNHDKARDAFEIEVDLLDDDKADIMIDLPLSERVRQGPDGAVEYLDEALPMAFESGEPLHRVYSGEDTLVSCAHPVAE